MVSYTRSCCSALRLATMVCRRRLLQQWHVVSAFPYRCSSMVRHDESMVLETQRRAMREAHEQRTKYLAEAR